jgi:hypothetical protein
MLVNFFPNENYIFKLPDHSWCPTEIVLANGEKHKEPLPYVEGMNFYNSVGLRFEAEAAREAIAKG